jgi:hypothetical protein
MHSSNEDIGLHEAEVLLLPADAIKCMWPYNQQFISKKSVHILVRKPKRDVHIPEVRCLDAVEMLFNT